MHPAFWFIQLGLKTFFFSDHSQACNHPHWTDSSPCCCLDRLIHILHHTHTCRKCGKMMLGQLIHTLHYTHV